MHSGLYGDYDNSVRREVCSLMTTEIRMPGEMIFTKGKLKHKMVYIVSGIVELSSTENVGAPIMSFGSGTVIGVISSMLPTISNSTFVCSTTCHLHVLNYSAIHKLYRIKRQVFNSLMENLKERIRFAKIKKHLLLNSKNSNKISHIMWVKNKWRAIEASNEEQNEESNILNECYSVGYLNLLALSSTQQWNKDIICIRGKCPFILQRESTFRNFLHYLNLIVIALQFMLTVKCIAFDREISNNLYAVLLILDLFYFLDIYIQVITMPKNFHSHKPLDIVLYQTRQISFIIDVIATIPYDYLGGVLKLDKHTTACLRIPRFLNLHKLVSYFVQLEFVCNLENLYLVKSMKFILLHIIFILSFVSLTYLIICFEGDCEYTWIWWSRSITRFFSDVKHKYDYLDIFHHMISIYMSINISNLTEVNSSELIISTIVATVGFYVCLFCLVQLTAVISLLQEFKHQYYLNMDILNEVTDRKDLLHLKSDIIKFAEIQWNLNKNQTLKDIYVLTGQESHYLHSIVNEEYVMECFRKTALFCEFDPRFLRQLASLSSLLVIPEGHSIYDPHHLLYHLYIIVEGFCLYKSYLPCDLDKQVTGILGKNYCFPVLSVFEQVPALVEISSFTTVILFCIPYLAIRKLFKAFPVEGKIINKAIEIHKYENRDVIKGPEPIRESSKKNKNRKVPTFEYSIERGQGCGSKHVSFNYRMKTIDLFFKKIIYTTYDPHSRKYLFYEVFRSICIIFEVSITMLTVISPVYICIVSTCKMPMLGFWILGLADIYIRGHVQYYNHIGIKVTELSKTFNNYVKSSFTIDFLATLPYEHLGLLGVFYKNPMRAYIVFMGVMRSLGIYRPIKLFLHFKNSVNPKYRIYFSISLSVIICLYFFLTTTHIYLIFTCDTTNNTFDVFKKSWINSYTSLENLKESYLYLVMFYIVSSLGITSTYSVFTYEENLLQLIIVIYIFVMRILATTYLLGGSHGNIKTAIHQDAIKDYLSFAKKKILSNRDKNEMLEHVGNYWKKSRGVSPQEIFGTFSPYMKEEIFLSLHRQALKLNYLFRDGDESLYRLVVCYMIEQYFKKGADIIRTNDVQDHLYIVASGHVNVYIADLYITTLRTGGIFGCFKPRGKARQTIRVTASVHIKILSIETILLYEIASLYPVVRARLHNIHVEMREFYTNEHSSNITNMDVGSTSHSRSKSQIKGGAMASFAWFYITVHERNQLYIIWNYITNVHVVSISSLYCLLVVVINIDIEEIWLWILLDVYFLAQMYIRSHLGYTDLESGVTVMLFESVVLRYVKSTNFYIDLFSILPLYLLSYIIPIRRSSLYVLNKLLRVGNLYTYYIYYIIRKNIPRHLKWTFLVYNTLFCLQSVFGFWYAVSDYTTEIKTVATYLRVISVCTKAGLVEAEFSNENQFIVNLALVYATQGLLIYILIVISRLLLDYNYTATRFKISILSLMHYCKNEYISKPLSEKVYTYVTYLFRYYNGRQEPGLFCTAPAYIVQNHKFALYGRIIESMPPFCHTHVDFMRQLYEHVKMSIYLPGDIIVEVGDCNSIMYFIEEGEVVAIEEVEGVLQCEIITKGVFGLIQGLTILPHTKTFRAKTTCSVISVCKKDWEFLLKYFPATNEILEDVIGEAMDHENENNKEMTDTDKSKTSIHNSFDSNDEFYDV